MNNGIKRYASEQYVNDLFNSNQKSVQPDWNQQDTTQSDYIKNKPFGTTFGIVEICNDTYTFVEDEGCFILSFSPLVLTEDSKYTVTFDNTKYDNLTPTIIFPEAGMGIIGNGSIVSEILGMSFEDTGEPFAIISGEAVIMVTNTGETSHHVVLGTQGETTKCLDDMYISDNIQRSSSDNLSTNDKTIVGAINEVDDICNNISNNKLDIAQGQDNIGKILVVDGGGNLSLTEKDVLVVSVWVETTGDAEKTIWGVTGGNGYNLPSYEELYSAITGHKAVFIADRTHFITVGVSGHSSDSIRFEHTVQNVTHTFICKNDYYNSWVYYQTEKKDVEVSEIIMKSSTEGSQKKFRITIDDSGILTATEITEAIVA